MSRFVRACAVGLVAVVPFTASTATAKGPSKKTLNKIYRDCSDGKINKKFKVKALKKAKRKLPQDVQQYTACKPALKKAIKKQSRKRGR